MSKEKIQLLTPRQAAEILQVTPRTVTKWCREGMIGAVKYGRVWRIRSDAIFARIIVPIKPKDDDGRL